MDWLAQIVFRCRLLIWIVVLGGAAALWLTSKPVQFDQSIEGFFPPDHPALLSYTRAKEIFGGDDFVFVAFEDSSLWTPDGMTRVRELSKALRANVTGVARVDSLDQMPLPWKVDAAVHSLVNLSPTGRALALPKLLSSARTVAAEVAAAADRPEDLQSLRERICVSPLFRNVLVDSRGTTTALVVQLKGADAIDHKQVVRELREQADAFGEKHGFGRVAVVGPPVLLADGFISLDKDNRTLGLVAMGLMALTMIVAVRSPWWAVLPLASGGAAWLATEAFLNFFDLRLTLSAGPIIAQTVVLCMPAASHLAMHFRESLREHANADDAARHTLATVFVPVAWCTVTAAAGYLATFSSTVRPFYQFGLTMAVTNLLAGTLAYSLAAGAMCPPSWLRLPSILLKRSPELPRSLALQSRANHSRLGATTAWVIAHPALTLALFVLPSCALGAGIMRLKVESNYIRIYRESSRVAQDYRFVEDRLGGIGLVELLLPAPKDSKEITPEWLDSLAETAAAVRDCDATLITEVLSLADVLQSTRPQEAESEKPPESEAEKPPDRTKTAGLLGGLLGRSKPADATPEQVVQTKLTFLGTPPFAHFVTNFWNRSGGRTRLLVRIRESAEADRKQRAFDAMLRIGQERFGPDSSVTGLSHLMTQVTRAIISTQFQATAWSAAVILVILVLALRSVPLAALALLPTMLAVGVVLGAMGWLGIKIDLSTALVACVATGLSVDDTFHCLLRWKREVRAGQPPLDALRQSYAGAGPGVVLSSAAVSLGFLALVFSEFVPTANFGWLVAVATLGGSLGNLVVLPALLAFLYRKRAATAAAAS